MKYFIIITLLVGFSMAFADDKETPEKLQQHKKEVLEHIDIKIQSLQKAKECVNAAQNKEAMKACHEQMKAEHQEMRKNHGRGYHK
ncbi:MAG: hypothetical protein A4S09_11900 [Proteobacteria bacterium SG_bin7]|nr:MAG: hypothetical protein A4S09_11900 [Proteobacteria bacterium SG_bin7]